MANENRSTARARGLAALRLSLACATALSVWASVAASAPSRVKSEGSSAPVSARPARKAPSGPSASAASASAASASAASASAASERPAAARTQAKSRARAKPKPPAAAASSGAAKPGTASAASSPTEAAVDAPGAKPAADVVKTEEARAGEKTYTFGAQEVEGRLQSPQLLYFLRRVRAEFDPAPLGHRSFLLELSDTRRHPAFR